MMKRKYILSCLLLCTLVTNLIHASGFEAPISQAAQAVGAAIVASVATAVAIATEIIRPVDPEKDLPHLSIQETLGPDLHKSIPQEIVLSQSKSSPAVSKAIVKPEDFQTPIWQPAQQKTASQEIVQIQPAPTILQQEIPISQAANTTQATLIAAQKLHLLKQTVATQHIGSEQPIFQKIIQQNTQSQQKHTSQNLQHTPVPFEWNDEAYTSEEEEPHCSFTQLHAEKRSNNYTDKFLYEHSIHFYFKRIEHSSLLKIDPVYQQLIMNRKTLSAIDKEVLLLRHEILIQGLHEAHQEIMLLQEQDSQSSNQTSEQQQNKNTPQFDPKDPKDKINSLLELAEKITASIFDLLKKKFPQFFRDGYGFWNKVKIASVSPAMQKVAEFFNIEKDELNIHIRHIFEPAIKLTKEGLYRINGFHHDINNVIEKSGNLFRFFDKHIYANGFYKATIQVAGNNATDIIQKSFFPAHWSPEKVMQEIHYVIRNMELIRQELPGNFTIVQDVPKYLANLPQSEPIIKFLGYTTDKINVMLIFDINKFAYVSAFPILGK